jgi:CheY-like chemotaxis protein
LVVDDEPSVRRLLAAALRQSGFSVRVASSGEEAVALYERLSFPKTSSGRFRWCVGSARDLRRGSDKGHKRWYNDMKNDSARMASPKCLQ